MVAPASPAPDLHGAALARWFVALRPAPAVRRALQREGERLAARCGGRVIPAERVHLTLAFIGSAPRALEDPLRTLVAALPPPGALTLDRLGSFDGRLLWLGPATAPAWLEDLARAACEALDVLGVPYDRRRFAAHLTLIRNARPTRGEALAALAATVTPIELGACTLHLVESTSDGGGLRYRFL